MGGKRKARNTDTGSDAACSSSKRGRRFFSAPLDSNLEVDRKGSHVISVETMNELLKAEDVMRMDHASVAREGSVLEMMPSIQDLSSEILAMIFGKLDIQDKVSTAGVCSQWRHIMDIPSVWKDFTVHLNLDTLTPDDLKKMQTRMIRKIRVTVCSNKEKLKEFLHAMPYLHELNLLHVGSLHLHLPTVFPTDLSSITRLCIPCHSSKTEDLESLAKRLINLQCLEIVEVVIDNISRIIKHFKRLIFLKLCYASHSSMEFAHGNVENLDPISCMRKVVLKNVTIGDTGLLFLSRIFPQLDSLEVTLSPDVTDDGIEKLAQLTELKVLSISSPNFHDDWMKRLGAALCKLNGFFISGQRGITLQCLQLICRMSALETLALPIHGLEVEGLCALSRNCPRLKTLYLAHGESSINQGLHFVGQMPNLESLMLLNCEVKDDFWLNCSQSFVKLNKLSFVLCRCLSDQFLPRLAQMPHLRSLLLSRCQSIGDAGMRLLGELALTLLILHELAVTDAGLLQLSGGLGPLRELCISSCSNVNQKAIVAAVSNCPSLQRLEGSLTIDTKHKLRLLKPRLTVVHSQDLCS